MSQTTEKNITITILQTSDVHGNILPIHYSNNGHKDVGLAKVSTLVKRERAKNPHTILIDNGDIIQGTPLTYHAAKFANKEIHPIVLALNEMFYDAVVIGNHEFNYGMELLQEAVRTSRFPWLSANILDKRTREPYFGKPYLIKNLVQGLKIGVLGLTTHYIPNWENPDHIKDLEFKDAVASAKKWVAILKNQEKVDIVILSYHGGFERDPSTGKKTETITGENQAYQLCVEVDGIDVLLTGHQHRMIADQQINGVTIVQPGSLGTSLGKVELKVNKISDLWKIVNKKSELLSVSDVEPDRKIIEMIQDYENQTQAWLDQPIGFVKGNMEIKDYLELRLKEHPIIEFINKVQMDVSGAEISNTALFDNQSPGFKEQITMRDVVSNYIYPNTLKVIKVTGQDIKDALERSAGYFQTYNDGEITINPSFSVPKPQHYNYDMWEGIEYKLNISKPLGKRVVELFFKGKNIDLTAEYQVVMNNYRAGGGGEYLMFKNKPVMKDIPIDMAELIANYIIEKKTIDATVNHNWEVVYDK